MTQKTDLQELADYIDETARDLNVVITDLRMIADKVRVLDLEAQRKRRNTIREDSIDILLQREGLPW